MIGLAEVEEDRSEVRVGVQRQVGDGFGANTVFADEGQRRLEFGKKSGIW